MGKKLHFLHEWHQFEITHYNKFGGENSSFTMLWYISKTFISILYAYKLIPNDFDSQRCETYDFSKVMIHFGWLTIGKKHIFPKNNIIFIFLMYVIIFNIILDVVSQRCNIYDFKVGDSFGMEWLLGRRKKSHGDFLGNNLEFPLVPCPFSHKMFLAERRFLNITHYNTFGDENSSFTMLWYNLKNIFSFKSLCI